MGATNRAGPGLKSLKDDGDAPDGQPETDGAHGEHEVDGVTSLPPAKDTRDSAGAAKHRAVLIVVPWVVGRAIGVAWIAGHLRVRGRVFIHRGYCTGN